MDVDSPSPMVSSEVFFYMFWPIPKWVMLTCEHPWRPKSLNFTVPQVGVATTKGNSCFNFQLCSGVIFHHQNEEIKKYDDIMNLTLPVNIQLPTISGFVSTFHSLVKSLSLKATSPLRLIKSPILWPLKHKNQWFQCAVAQLFQVIPHSKLLTCWYFNLFW